MVNCEYCEIVNGTRKAAVLYEDAEIMAVVRDVVMTPGQITVIPKEHHVIMENVPDGVLRKCAIIANKVSIAAFESLGCQGTNILVQNGISAGQKMPHFALEVVPRVESDGINLQWNTKQLSEDELETTYLILKEEGDKLLNVGKVAEIKKVEVKKEEPKNEKNKDSYLVKVLRRKP